MALVMFCIYGIFGNKPLLLVVPGSEIVKHTPKDMGEGK